MTGEEVGGVAIRRARSDDWPGIRRLVGAAGLPLDGLTDDHAVFVAMCGDRLVGTATLERHGVDDGVAYLLRSVVVDDGAHGSGIGGRLVERTLSDAPPGRPVALLTETAAGWFPRFGFVAVDRAELPASLAGSEELRGACPASAQALLRRSPGGDRGVTAATEVDESAR